MHILYLANKSGGHHPDYVRHFAEFWALKRPDIKMTLLLSPYLLRENPDVFRLVNKTIQQNAKFGYREIKKEEADIVNGTNLMKVGLGELRLVSQYLSMLKGDHAILDLDHLQLMLALGYRLPRGKSISGILVRPSMHFIEVFKDRFEAKERMKMLRKRILHRCMLKHQALKAVYTFDPYFQKYAANKLPYGHKVNFIPDPNLFPGETHDDMTKYSWMQGFPQNRKLFFLFGALSRRKGVIETLKALHYLEPEHARRIAVVIAGRGSSADIESEIWAECNLVRQNCKDIWLHFENRYIEREEIAFILKYCDFVLMPYQKWDGPSGVLSWAAGVGKPVLTQNTGLLGAYVRDEKLGITGETSNPRVLAEMLRRCISKGLNSYFDPESARDFVKDCTPGNFVAQILMPLVGDLV